MEELLRILNDIRPDVDFAKEKDLVDGGVLDSFDIVIMVPEINESFNVNIPVSEINPENFSSAESIMALIGRLQGK
ncbi:MAG: phosphopantetheine-binding protein [Clostridiales Family XIII bacterium]|jgi:acyl carrier protein|nr:phosphopantetheine-binding protein [Clostridiales Family XIII bacterium]